MSVTLSSSMLPFLKIILEYVIIYLGKNKTKTVILFVFYLEQHLLSLLQDLRRPQRPAELVVALLALSVDELVILALSISGAEILSVTAGVE